MESSLYTFLLPAYKVKFFAEALESIKTQTYKKFRVIVSDDNSPEDIKCIYDRVVGTDPRFVYRCNVKNMGSKSLVSHWNLLVDMCETEYFIMASDDDVYESNFLEEIDKLIKKYPCIDLFRGRMKCIGEQGHTLITDCACAEYYDQVHFFRKYYANDMLTCEANYCYRTEALKKHGYYEEYPKAWFTDDATHIKMSENGCAMTKDIVFSYRDSDLSISNIWNNRIDSVLKLKASFLYWKWISKEVEGMEDKEELRINQIALSRCKDKIVKQIERHIVSCNLKDVLLYSKLASSELGMSRMVLLYYWIRIYTHKLLCHE